MITFQNVRGCREFAEKSFELEYLQNQMFQIMKFGPPKKNIASFHCPISYLSALGIKQRIIF